MSSWPPPGGTPPPPGGTPPPTPPWQQAPPPPSAPQPQWSPPPGAEPQWGQPAAAPPQWGAPQWTPTPGQAPPAGAPSDRRPGPNVVVSLVVIALGLALLIPSLVQAVRPIASTLTAPTMSTPGTATRDLEAGEHVVFQRTGTRSGNGGFTFGSDEGVTLASDEITIIGPDGEEIFAHPRAANETIDKNGATFTAAATFAAPVAGEYEITVSREEPGQVIVAPSITEDLGSSGRWFLLAIAGGLLGLLGVVLLIVGIVRRSGRQAPPSAPGYAPAYGYGYGPAPVPPPGGPPPW